MRKLSLFRIINVATTVRRELVNNKILVVDDEQAVKNSLKKAFETAGQTVVCAGTAEEALEILKRENIQVMFLDLNLPSMSGIELCRKIRNDRPFAAIHALTGYTSIFDLVDCKEAGFDDYFTKPIELKALLEATNNAFERLNRWKRQWWGE
jgi:DNA-binding response OmpR family regulator